MSKENKIIITQLEWGNFSRNRVKSVDLSVVKNIIKDLKKEDPNTNLEEVRSTIIDYINDQLWDDRYPDIEVSFNNEDFDIEDRENIESCDNYPELMNKIEEFFKE